MQEGPFPGLFWCLGHRDCANDNQPRPTVRESTLHKSERSLRGERAAAASMEWREPQWEGALPSWGLFTSLVAISSVAE